MIVTPTCNPHGEPLAANAMKPVNTGSSTRHCKEIE